MSFHIYFLRMNLHSCFIWKNFSNLGHIPTIISQGLFEFLSLFIIPNRKKSTLRFNMKVTFFNLTFISLFSTWPFSKNLRRRILLSLFYHALSCNFSYSWFLSYLSFDTTLDVFTFFIFSSYHFIMIYLFILDQDFIFLTWPKLVFFILKLTHILLFNEAE